MALVTIPGADGETALKIDSSLIVLAENTPSINGVVSRIHYADTKVSPIKMLESSASITSYLNDPTNQNMTEMTSGVNSVFINTNCINNYVDGEFIDVDFFGSVRRIYGLTFI